jgi:hypothetical protein
LYFTITSIKFAFTISNYKKDLQDFVEYSSFYQNNDGFR